MELAALFTKTTDTVGTLVVDIGTGESLNKKSDPEAAASEEGNDTGIIPLSYAFHEEQVLVFKLVHLIIPDNTDIDYQMMVVPRKRLCKIPANHYFTPSHASFYFQPDCLIMSRT